MVFRWKKHSIKEWLEGDFNGKTEPIPSVFFGWWGTVVQLLFLFGQGWGGGRGAAFLEDKWLFLFAWHGGVRTKEEILLCLNRKSLLFLSASAWLSELHLKKKKHM